MTPSKITLRINDTPAGRLFARAITIMDQTPGLTMDDAMDRAKAILDRLSRPFPSGTHVNVLMEEPDPGSGIGAIEGFVLAPGPVFSNVVMVPSQENLNTAREILADLGDTLHAHREGPVYVLRDVRNDAIESYEEMER